MLKFYSLLFLFVLLQDAIINRILCVMSAATRFYSKFHTIKICRIKMKQGSFSVKPEITKVIEMSIKI